MGRLTVLCMEEIVVISNYIGVLEALESPGLISEGERTEPVSGDYRLNVEESYHTSS